MHPEFTLENPIPGQAIRDGHMTPSRDGHMTWQIKKKKKKEKKNSHKLFTFYLSHF